MEYGQEWCCFPFKVMQSIREIWAKSPTNQHRDGQSLVDHTADVVDRLALLKKRQPNLSNICQCDRLWYRTAVACALHDLGKCAPGFQAMLRPNGATFGERHEVLSLALLPMLFPEDDEGDLPWIAAGIASHHRDLSVLRRKYDPGDATMDLPDGCERLSTVLGPDCMLQMWVIATQYLLPQVSKILNEWQYSAPPPPDFSASASWVPGNIRKCFDMLEKLAAQANGTTPKALACRYLRGLVLLCDHAGSAHENFRVLPQMHDLGKLFVTLKLEEGRCYPHQSAIASSRGNSVLISPTGSGKTEAALLWACAQRQSTCGDPPLLYVLPYQASLNAMRYRLGVLFGDESVALQHSRALQALYSELMGREYSSAGAVKAAMRGRSLAKLHVCPIRVLTPYQLLRAAYQLKGHAAIWTDAAESLVVLDEIHAYEESRLGIILETVSHLVNECGSKVLVVSATLPTITVQELRDAVGDVNVITASTAIFRQFRRHRVRLVDADLLDESTVERVAESAQSGMAVLVVATTVRRAQSMRDALIRRLGTDIELLHSKFCPKDRFLKERRLLSILGTGSGKRSAVILVATQVVEVSLDIDFDVLFSDPAPLEALVQRFGRVNRKGRLGPEALADVVVMSRTPPGCPVYPQSLIDSALDCLTEANGQAIDEGIVQGWLDRIYSGEIANAWRARVRRSRSDFRRDVLNSLSVFDSSEDLSDRFDELFDGSEVLPMSLRETYNDTLQIEPLLAPSFLVSVSFGQLMYLKRRRLLAHRNANDIFIADVPYDDQTGLRLYDSPDSE